MVSHWIGSWSTAQQLTEPDNLPKELSLSGNTLRQNVRLSLGGARVRLRLSNQYGSEVLRIRGVCVAAAATAHEIMPGTSRSMTFDGQRSLAIAPHETALSDPLDLVAHPLGVLSVSLSLGEVPRDVTGHPASRTTSYLKLGDCASARALPGATPIEHWYILSQIEVLAPRDACTVVFLGDSIVDGRGSTPNGFNRFPDGLAERLQADPRTALVGVLNHGIGGNAVCHGGLGPTALQRFHRDVLTQSGARWLLLLEGVNDIGNARKETVTELITSYQTMIGQAHAAGIAVLGGTLLPFGGSGYDSAEREADRQRVNDWIRHSGQFDHVLDLEQVVRDPLRPTALLPEYDSGDHLHLNPEGYRALADSVDLGLFRGD